MLHRNLDHEHELKVACLHKLIFVCVASCFVFLRDHIKVTKKKCVSAEMLPPMAVSAPL